MEAGDVAFAIKRLEMCVELRSKSLYKGHPDLGRSADKLAQCYALVGRALFIFFFKKLCLGPALFNSRSL